jgi:KaiC/GvpD/RAD55 family RecA-like ATPase
VEQQILAAAVRDREAFQVVLSLDVDDEFSDQGHIIWDLVKDYYGNDAEAESVDRTILVSKIERKYPKHFKALSNFLDDCETEEVSIPNLQRELYELKLDNLSDKIAGCMAAKNFDEATPLLEEYHRLRTDEEIVSAKDNKVLQDVSVHDLLERTSHENLTKVLPAQLNNRIEGGLLPGHHMVVFAPTDMGKTLFAVNLAYGFLKQGKRVLYVGNEDPAEDILTRLLTRMTGMTAKEIRRNPDRADDIAHRRGYENFTLVEADPGTEAELRGYIEEYEPDVLIVDQIRNLDMKESNKVLQLERAAQMMRNFGKRYDLIPVSFTQAGDSATGNKFLGRGDIDYSNVGIPGTADVLIGIGADEDMERQGFRMLSLVKNKRGGNKEPIRVRFLHNLSKVE